MFHLSEAKHVDFAKIYAKINHIYDELPPVKRKRKKRKIILALKIGSLAVFWFWFLA
jgi:hypothetical protein